MGNRKGVLFAFVTSASVLALASTAFACVTFMGKMEVEGHDGKTEVVGTGNLHRYCLEDGRPTTAAAGHLTDTIDIKVKPGICADPDAVAQHQLPEGTYQVRYNNELSYTYDGTYWTMRPGLGCFRPDNADTTTTLGTFNVDAAGNGAWSGTLGTLKQDPFYATPLTASNICVGAPSLPPVNGIIPGMLAPYQLLAI